MAWSALNDDLCLCKCNPPPKLVHSQMSFKEKVSSQGMAISAIQLKESPTQTPSTYSTSVRFVDDDGYPYAKSHIPPKTKRQVRYIQAERMKMVKPHTFLQIHLMIMKLNWTWTGKIRR